MCNEMQVPRIDWMLWNHQLLAGQMLLHPICSLHQVDPKDRVADLKRWFAAICIKNSGRIFHWVSVINAGLMGGLPICSLHENFFS
jgi:hypothetical protein